MKSSMKNRVKSKVESTWTRNQNVVQYELGNYKNFVYFILDWDSKEAVVIDPHGPLSKILDDLDGNGFTLQKILITHTHHDHIAGIPELLKANSSLEIFLHKEEAHRMGPWEKNLHWIQDGDEIGVGSLKIKVLHTPGHSSGECSYFLEGTPPSLFSGDTIFIKDCGRTDLPTGSTEQMFQSLQRIKKLPPETILFPGHHYKVECSSTLGREFMGSPPFQCKTVQELEALP